MYLIWSFFIITGIFAMSTDKRFKANPHRASAATLVAASIGIHGDA